MEREALFKMVCVDHRCPQCGGKTRQVDKDTSSGSDMREFECEACHWNTVFEFGPALWKVMSDAKNEPRGEKQ
jgi:rubredoxin